MSNRQSRSGIVAKILDYPWHFVALTAVFMVWGYILNPDLFDLGQVLLYTVVGIVTATLLFLILKRFMLLHNAGLLTTIYVALFFSYGHLFEAMVLIAELFSVGIRFLLANYAAIYVGLLILILVLMFLQKRHFPRITTFLNVMALTTFVIVAGNLIQAVSLVQGAAQNKLDNPALQNIRLPETEPDTLPDIYYIILDGYSSNSHLLSHFGYDNSEFTDALESFGFYVAYDSVSNYTYTILSLSSSLNLSYIHEQVPEDTIAIDVMPFAVDNLVARNLQSLGYEYYVVAGGYFPYSTIADVTIDVDLSGELIYSGSGEEPPSMVSDYQQYLSRTTLLRMLDPSFGELVGEFNSWRGLDRMEPQLDALANIAADDAPTVTFFHLLKPHLPVVMDREGNAFHWFDHYADVVTYRKNEHIHFADQLMYINKRMLEVVESILEQSSEPPIIIIQGDHGSYLPFKRGREQYGNYPIPILNAYYFPGQDYGRLRQDITPINSFRVIFDQYFNIGYDELPEHSYYQPYSRLQTTRRYMDVVRMKEGQTDPPYEPAEETSNTANRR